MRRSMLVKLFVAITLLSGVMPAFSQTTAPAEPVDPKRLAWFREAKFGMFIHWGVYSAIAGEWKGKQDPNIGEWAALQFNIPGAEYEEVAKNFNPQKFDANKWVKIAKDAGMNYIVFTTKHHDGFCMFGTKQTNFNIVDFTPFHRDVLKELAEACRKNDMKLGLYYSIADWHHPEFPPQYSNHHSGYHEFPNPNADVSKYADYELAQVRELLTNYGDIATIWFDGGGAFQDADRYNLLKGDQLVDLIHQLQPDCLINNRIGGTRYDYGTPEQKIPGTIQDQAFETCMTIGKKWGYNKFETDLKSSQELTRDLIDIASKGGNFLLNTGPNADGEIIPSHVERLKEIGKWLDDNGGSIYGTYASVLPDLPWGRSTTEVREGGDASRVYLHVFDWPKDGKLFVPGLQNKGRAFLLTDYPGTQYKVENSPEGMTISGLPADMPNPIATVIAIEFKGKPKVKVSATAPASPTTNPAQ